VKTESKYFWKDFTYHQIYKKKAEKTYNPAHARHFDYPLFGEGVDDGTVG